MMSEPFIEVGLVLEADSQTVRLRRNVTGDGDALPVVLPHVGLVFEL